MNNGIKKNKKMKTKYLLYIASIIFLAGSMYLLVVYPNSGRMNMIAGTLAFIGFPLNIGGFAMKK